MSAGSLFRAVAITVLAILPLAVSLNAAERTEEDPWKAECEFGITLAFGGEIAKAESVFVSLLSHEPGSARALTNLGNIQVIQGELDVALSFYDRAITADSADGGIRLNRAVALMLMGEEEDAQVEAREGVKIAGNLGSAASLLGLRSIQAQESERRGAEKLYVSKEEIGSLLAAALKSVPSDSTQDSSGTGAEPREKKPAQAWRSAGARAAQQTEVASVLYWKR
ncbi:MAG: tetratricopeptide repeat protein [Candidatus Eiseniibacteriota bacterium]|nr:MAG: tetratricopeptide repeat protein [Candidatus Eisenbacteria bacterium]